MTSTPPRGGRKRLVRFIVFLTLAGLAMFGLSTATAVAAPRIVTSATNPPTQGLVTFQRHAATDNGHDQYIGSKVLDDWSFAVKSGGFPSGTAVTFSFREGSDMSQNSDPRYYIGLPRDIANSLVAIRDSRLAGDSNGSHNVGQLTRPDNCITNADGASPKAGYRHPTAVTVDWAKQAFSVTVPYIVQADDLLQFCFSHKIDMGNALVLQSSDSTGGVPKEYSVFYDEPNGMWESDMYGDRAGFWSQSYGYGYGGCSQYGSYYAHRCGADLEEPDHQNCNREGGGNCDEGSSFMHIFRADGEDLSQAGTGFKGPGVNDAVYSVGLQGTPGATYSITAEYDTGVVDPRVTVTCAASCVADNKGEVRASFTVSCGALNHFALVSANTGTTNSDKAEANGVTAFTTAASTCPAAASQGTHLGVTGTWSGHFASVRRTAVVPAHVPAGGALGGWQLPGLLLVAGLLGASLIPRRHSA